MSMKRVVRGVVGDGGIDDDEGGRRGMRREERKQRASRKGTAKERETLDILARTMMIEEE
jgi:hypothetical protein